MHTVHVRSARLCGASHAWAELGTTGDHWGCWADARGWYGMVWQWCGRWGTGGDRGGRRGMAGRPPWNGYVTTDEHTMYSCEDDVWRASTCIGSQTYTIRPSLPAPIMPLMSRPPGDHPTQHTKFATVSKDTDRPCQSDLDGPTCMYVHAFALARQPGAR